MEVILYISVAIIAVAFFILVVYITRTLRSLQMTLTSVSHTLDGLEKQLQGVTSETTSLLQKTNVLAEDLQQKSESLNGVVSAVKEVGRSVQKFNHSVDRIADRVTSQMNEQEEKISQVVQWGNVALEIRDRFRARKKQPTQVEQPIVVPNEREADPQSKKPERKRSRSRSYDGA